jgi:hypothetical protein
MTKIKLGMVAHGVILAMWEAEVGRRLSKVGLDKSVTPCMKNN